MPTSSPTFAGPWGRETPVCLLSCIAQRLFRPTRGSAAGIRPPGKSSQLASGGRPAPRQASEQASAAARCPRFSNLYRPNEFQDFVDLGAADWQKRKPATNSILARIECPASCVVKNLPAQYYARRAVF